MGYAAVRSIGWSRRLFITLLLWPALRFPMRHHPLFRLIRDRDDEDTSSMILWRISQIGLVIALALVALMSPALAVVILVGVAIGLPVLAIMFNGTVLGLNWIGTISQALAREKRSGRFDLLTLTPPGASGISWLVCAAIVHRDDLLQQVYRIVRLTLSFVLVLLGVAFIALSYGWLMSENRSLQSAQVILILDVIIVSLFIIGLWFDHIQSVILATLIGITLPLVSNNSLYLPVLARSLYLMLQASTYIISSIFYLIVNRLIAALHPETGWEGFVAAGITLIGFTLLREIQISLLWRWLLFRHQATPQDFIDSIQGQ